MKGKTGTSDSSRTVGIISLSSKMVEEEIKQVRERERGGERKINNVLRKRKKESMLS